MALPIFLISRLLSDKDDTGVRRSLAKNSLSGVVIKITAFAGTSSLAQGFKCAMRGQKISRGLWQFNCHDFRLSFFGRRKQSFPANYGGTCESASSYIELINFIQRPGTLARLFQRRRNGIVIYEI